jgi:hypothetical protein
MIYNHPNPNINCQKRMSGNLAQNIGANFNIHAQAAHLTPKGNNFQTWEKNLLGSSLRDCSVGLTMGLGNSQENENGVFDLNVGPGPNDGSSSYLFNSIAGVKNKSLKLGSGNWQQRPDFAKNFNHKYNYSRQNIFMGNQYTPLLTLQGERVDLPEKRVLESKYSQFIKMNNILEPNHNPDTKNQNNTISNLNTIAKFKTHI